MSEDIKDYELWVGDEMVAGAFGPKKRAWQEIMRYAHQYADEGMVRIYEVKRTLVALEAE